MEVKSKSLLQPTIFNLWVLLVLLLLTGCGGSKAGGEVKDYAQLQELINNREFQIEHQWAMPVGGRNINLSGNSNFIRFEGDSVDIFLPYFGVRHSGGGYGSEGGIRYEGPVEDFQMKEHPQEKNIQLSFEGDHQNENLNFSIMLYPNGSARTSVTSSERSSISYRGELGALEKRD